MAHVALIDDNNVVQTVHVIDNDKLPNNGSFSPEVEYAANEFQHALGLMGNWRLTSYNNKFRKQYAGKGYTYDPVNDIFISPSPYPSWILNNEGDWISPVPYPQDGLSYRWDEVNKQWVLNEINAPQQGK